MKLSNEIITTAFYTRGVSACDQVERIGELVRNNGVATFLDKSTTAGSPAVESLLLGYDPRSVAQIVFIGCQEISLDAYCAEVGTGERAKAQAGMSAETAVHGLLWWGIKTDGTFGRYTRIATSKEDESDPFARKNGYDIIFRTDRRRHRIQVKSNAEEAEYVNRYADDIIVVSPAQLLGDSRAVTIDLHEAIVAEDIDVLSGAINRFTQVLHTQKATNGRRKVI